MIGLQENSDKKEIVVGTNGETVRYRVVAENIDVKLLEEELKGLQSLLKEAKPTEQELIEAGKSKYPHIFDEMARENIEKRINEITAILGATDVSSTK